MIKTHQEEETKTITVIDDIICNKCGESMGGSCGYEGLNAHLSGGYDSKIGDGTIVEFCICESCLLKMFDEFKIPPTYNEEGWCCADEPDENKNPCEWSRMEKI